MGFHSKVPCWVRVLLVSCKLDRVPRPEEFSLRRLMLIADWQSITNDMFLPALLLTRRMVAFFLGTAASPRDNSIASSKRRWLAEIGILVREGRLRRRF